MERIPDIIHPSWHPHMELLFDNPKMTMLRDQILPACKYFPEPKNIFRVFSTSLEDIRVVALGQDPYHNTGEATGLAFAVPSTKSMPPSLRIIQQEIINENVERDTHTNIDSDKWRTLVHWKQQGVFLLNSALTVEAHSPNTHTNYWAWFTREIVKVISVYSNNPVWFLWGSKAKGFRDYIVNRKSYIHGMDNYSKESNYVLEADHPAAETYPNSTYKFSGCNHFRLCNEILKSKGLRIINW